jgi:hypothetical protein
VKITISFQHFRKIKKKIQIYFFVGEKSVVLFDDLVEFLQIERNRFGLEHLELFCFGRLVGFVVSLRDFLEGRK